MSFDGFYARARKRLLPFTLTPLALAVSLVFGTTGTARAEAVLPTPSANAAPVDLDAVRTDLLQSTLPRVEHKVGDQSVTTFTLRPGTTISVGDDSLDRGARLGAGNDGLLYIQLNRTDQQALVNGSAAALGVALCAIPAVGWVACAGIAAALGVATVYVNAHGLCPTSKPQLRLYPGTQIARCLK